jgi:hypothetical protein
MSLTKTRKERPYIKIHIMPPGTVVHIQWSIADSQRHDLHFPFEGIGRSYTRARIDVRSGVSQQKNDSLDKAQRNEF